MYTHQLISSPKKVDIMITNRCNLSCNYCSYNDKSIRSGTDLSTAEWQSFFAELEDWKVMSVILTGGEPFARNDILALIDSVVVHQLRFYIFSNGTFITKDIVNYLVGSKRFDGILISLDGSNADVQDQISGKGAFRLALQGLNYLLEFGAPVAVRITVVRRNVADVINNCNMLMGLGVKSIEVVEAYPFGGGKKNYDQIKLTEIQHQRLEDEIVEFDKINPGILMDSGPLKAHRIRQTALDSIVGGMPPALSETGYLSGCRCSYRNLTVTHDGYFIPCMYLSGFKLGRIGEDSLLHIWKNSPMLNKLRSRREVRLSDTVFCKDCNFTDLCTGNCAGLAYAITGDIDSADPSTCYRSYYDGIKQYVH
jgi:SynChlorMet cassette radical SAM/SPASM protein ScmE